MKPPVEAPTSSARRPSTASPQASSALASLMPPRETNRGARLDAHAAPPRRPVRPACAARRSPAPDAHLAGHHRRGRTAARGEQAALGEQRVETSLCHRGEPLHTNAPGRGASQRRSAAAPSLPRAPALHPDASRLQPRRPLDSATGRSPACRPPGRCGEAAEQRHTGSRTTPANSCVIAFEPNSEASLAGASDCETRHLYRSPTTVPVRVVDLVTLLVAHRQDVCLGHVHFVGTAPQRARAVADTTTTRSAASIN